MAEHQLLALAKHLTGCWDLITGSVWDRPRWGWVPEWLHFSALWFISVFSWGIKHSL